MTFLYVILILAFPPKFFSLSGVLSYCNFILFIPFLQYFQFYSHRKEIQEIRLYGVVKLFEGRFRIRENILIFFFYNYPKDF